ncbi:MAG: hypothetical protein IJL90_05080 [Lachnospiraceae bacterium]|nr:hypothetical protein [Lachnospiraceae bacterium]
MLPMTSDDMTYESACAYIEDAARLGSRPGLSRIEELCAHLGHPEEKLRFIHVAGTNGKGSTAAMIASALAAAGLKTGMYYSPALCGPRDHYAINGVMISEDDYSSCISEVATANAMLSESATQFELETAAAFLYFGKNHCDAVVCECGMGGRDDATNIIKNKICCVITSVSFDHMQYLGNTLHEIAGVKAGIITSNCPVIALDSGCEVMDAIESRCRTTKSALYKVSPPYPDIACSLEGTFQKENATVAYKCLCVIRDENLIKGCRLTDDIIRKGIADTVWPFRFEKICSDPLVYVDGAHNERAAMMLEETITLDLAGYEKILVMGMFSDKEYDKVVSRLAPLASMIFTVQTPGSARALSAEDLAVCAKRYCGNVRACSDLEEAARLALKAANDVQGDKRGAVIACGSLSYLNGFKEAVRSAAG